MSIRTLLSPIRWPKAVGPILAIILIAGACSSDDAESTTTMAAAAPTTSVAAPAAVAQAATEAVGTPLQLTFNGEHCVYEGPVEVVAGPVELFYVNESDEVAWVTFNRHTGDETIQDAVAHFGDSPSSTPCPSWKRDVIRTSVQPGDTCHWEGDLEPATYHMVCYRNPPLSVWFGTGLTVNG